MQGIRKVWTGLKIKMDKTKQLEIIESYSEKEWFIIKLKKGEVLRHISRSEFIIPRK